MLVVCTQMHWELELAREMKKKQQTQIVFA